MAKFEETGAAVGAMLPVTPVSEVLSKAPTVESVDNEFSALQLSDDTNNNPDTTEPVELPDGIPPAESPIDQDPVNNEEKPASPEEIASLRNLEATMESYFADVEIGKPYTESVDSEKGDVMTEDVDHTGMSSAEHIYLESGMDEIAKLSRDAGINDYAKNNGDFYVAESAQSEFFSSGENEMFTEGADSEHNPNIDDDIKPIIKMLNEKGYKTIASCSGHPSARRKDDRYRDGIRYGKLYSGARIVFDKDYDLPNVPEGWTKKTMEEDHRIGIYVVAPRFKIIDGLPEKNYTNWKRRYMRSLEKWAKELPKVGEVKETGDKLTLESVLYDISVDAMVGE